jgi:hypothetical protein
MLGGRAVPPILHQYDLEPVAQAFKRISVADGDARGATRAVVFGAVAWRATDAQRAVSRDARDEETNNKMAAQRRQFSKGVESLDRDDTMEMAGCGCRRL